MTNKKSKFCFYYNLFSKIAQKIKHNISKYKRKIERERKKEKKVVILLIIIIVSNFFNYRLKSN